MKTPTNLPLTETIEPADQQELAEVVRAAVADKTPIYPIGGQTSLDYGLPATKPGIGLSLAKLNRVIDYPARDLTITVEAGVTMETLAETLQAERQQLPIDVPQLARATIGGAIATNSNGPRRYFHGVMRDYVIGIRAIDGHATVFNGGGRVVKNVAGYDFCKLLTGSLGTLGVISQVTLKLKPLAQRTALVACRVPDWNKAEQLLNALVHSKTTPAAIELLRGPEWHSDPVLGVLLTHEPRPAAVLLVGLEGTVPEVSWMVDQLSLELREQGVEDVRLIFTPEAEGLWKRLAEFPSHAPSPLVLQANILPSAVASWIETATAVDPEISIQAHAGSGAIIARFSAFPPTGLSRTLIASLAPAAIKAHGHVVVLSNPGGAEMTRQTVWGGIELPLEIMGKVKNAFDPHHLLNPGRFVYL